MQFAKTAIILAFFLAAGSCGGGGGGYLRALERQNLTLPSTVSVEDFRAACSAMSVVDPDSLLKSLNIRVRGKGPGAYVSTSDLVAACGPECAPDDSGLGSLLVKFAVYDQTR